MGEIERTEKTNCFRVTWIEDSFFSLGAMCIFVDKVANCKHLLRLVPVKHHILQWLPTLSMCLTTLIKVEERKTFTEACMVFTPLYFNKNYETY